MIKFDLYAIPIVSEDATFTFNKKEISFIEKLEYKKTHNVTIPDCGVKVSKTENVFKHKEFLKIESTQKNLRLKIVCTHNKFIYIQLYICPAHLGRILGTELNLRNRL
mgnify:CR=1 FL=1